MSKTTTPATAWVRMLCNRGEYLNGQEYEVAIDEANAMTGLGMAVLINHAPAREEE